MSQKESAPSVRLNPSGLVCRSHGWCHFYGGLPEEILLQQRVSGILRSQWLKIIVCLWSYLGEARSLVFVLRLQLTELSCAAQLCGGCIRHKPLLQVQQPNSPACHLLPLLGSCCSCSCLRVHGQAIWSQGELQHMKPISMTHLNGK